MAKVTILLSVYRPNPVYFRQQLASLNEQTYEDLELLIRNDCPEEKLDRELIGQEITRFPIDRDPVPDASVFCRHFFFADSGKIIIISSETIE